MNLLESLEIYKPADESEAQMVAQLREFLREAKEPFSRELSGQEPNWGHVTASAWVVNSDFSRVVLLHHGKLNRWVQPGGHLEPEDAGDVRAAAMREAREEIGLEVELISEQIFDVDVHQIPEYWNTPAHFHYDVRFLLRSDDTFGPICSLESKAACWMNLDEALELSQSRESVARMVRKTRLLQSPRNAPHRAGARWHR